MEKVLSLAKLHINEFSFDKNFDKLSESHKQISVLGEGQIFIRDIGSLVGKITVNFAKLRNCKVYIGANFKGNLAIDFHGEDSIVYIGDNCILGSVAIRSIAIHKQLTFIGNNVTATGKCVFYSGDGTGGGGTTLPALVVGDDCMFAWDITVRNTDAHPIYNRTSGEQVNEPSKGIVCIEPHVWVGQNVSILKDVTVGACSIVGLGSTVTNDIPRFSRAVGVPAKYKVDPNIFWSRSSNDACKKKALYYADKYEIK